MYKMKFINNKWNPTFSRNTKSSRSFPLSLSVVCSCAGLGQHRELEKGAFEHGSQWAPRFGPPPFFPPLKILSFLSTAACLDLSIFNLSPLSFLHAPNTCITWVSNASRNPWRHRVFHAQVVTSSSCQKRSTTTHAISSHPNFHASKIQTENQT